MHATTWGGTHSDEPLTREVVGESVPPGDGHQTPVALQLAGAASTTVAPPPAEADRCTNSREARERKKEEREKETRKDEGEETESKKSPIKKGGNSCKILCSLTKDKSGEDKEEKEEKERKRKEVGKKEHEGKDAQADDGAPALEEQALCGDLAARLLPPSGCVVYRKEPAQEEGATSSFSASRRAQRQQARRADKAKAHSLSLAFFQGPRAEPSLAPVSRTSGGRTIRAVIDSGAEDTVTPPGVMPGAVVPSTMSRTGRTYRGANGAPIANFGKVTVEFRDADGVKCGMHFQVADVERPLVSAAKLADAGNRVVLERGGGFVENVSTGRKIHLVREGNVFVLDMFVCGEAEEEQGGGGGGVRGGGARGAPERGGARGAPEASGFARQER